MILNEANIQQIIADRGIDWIIDNTQKIIKRYSKQPYAYWFVVKRYSKLLKKLMDIKDDKKSSGTKQNYDYNK